MEAIRNSISEAKNLVLGTGPQSGSEPVSGQQGAGTEDRPYDQGNALSNAANAPDAKLTQPSAEPPSGAQGAGTANRPYDGGNASSATANKLDTQAVGSGTGSTAQGPTSPSDGPPLSKVTSKPGTPYDIIGLSRKASKAQQAGAEPGTPTGETSSIQQEPSIYAQTTSPNTKPAPIAEEPAPAPTQTETRAPVAAPAPAPAPATTTSIPASTAPSSTAPVSQTSAEKQPERESRPSQKWPAKEKEQIREISPGTREDGSHATTSGDRGESYEPGRLNRLKGAFSRK